MVLEAILFRSHHVSTLILGDFDLPLPGGGGGPGVDINVDLITLRGGRDEHVLSRVVATDSGRNRTSRVGDGQSVRKAVSHGDAVNCRRGAGDSCWSRENHRVEVYPQFADISVGGAEGVRAGVLVRTGGVGGHHSVGVVGTAAAATSDGEDTANSEGRCTGSGGCSSEGAAL